MSYSQEHLTDGFISEDVLPMLGVRHHYRRNAAKLLEVRLFDPAPGGYQIHDYGQYNASMVSVRADRRWDQFRKELYGVVGLRNALLRRDNSACRYCRNVVNWTDRRGPNGGVFRKVNIHGDTVLENIVTCCRRCHIQQDQEPSAPLPLFTGTSSDLVQNQLEPSSDLSLRARASFPSHPISTKEEVHTHTGDAAAPPPGPRPVPPSPTPKSAKTCPKFLPDEFLAGMGAHADAEKLAAWIADTETRRATEQPVVDDNIAWWRRKFKTWVRENGWTEKKPSGKKRGANVSAYDRNEKWTKCKHVPACADMKNHRRLVEAELSNNPEYVAAVIRMNARARREGVH